MEDLYAEAKKFLRLDDDEQIDFYVDVAVEYAEAAVGKLDYSKKRVQYLVLAIVQELHDNRTYDYQSVAKGDNEKLRNVIRSMITQLQLEADDEN